MTSDELELLCKPVHDRLQANDADGAVTLLLAMPLRIGKRVAQALDFYGAGIAKNKTEYIRVCEKYAPLRTRAANEKYNAKLALESIYLRVRHIVECCELGRTLIDVGHELFVKYKLSPSELIERLTDGDMELLNEKYELTKTELAKYLAELVPNAPQHNELKARGEALLAEDFKNWLRRCWPNHVMHANKFTPV